MAGNRFCSCDICRDAYDPATGEKRTGQWIKPSTFKLHQTAQKQRNSDILTTPAATTVPSPLVPKPVPPRDIIADLLAEVEHITAQFSQNSPLQFVNTPTSDISFQYPTSLQGRTIPPVNATPFSLVYNHRANFGFLETEKRMVEILFEVDRMQPSETWAVLEDLVWELLQRMYELKEREWSRQQRCPSSGEDFTYNTS